MLADGSGTAYLLASDNRAARRRRTSEEVKRRIEEIDSGKVKMIPRSCRPISISTIPSFDSQPKGSLELAQKGLAILKELARRPDVQAYQLFDTVNGLITVEPPQLREPALAVKYAERIVDASSRRNPEFLLTLAEAYRADGQPSKARTAAKEGLALLPPETSATVMSRVRKLLHAQIDS